MQSNGSATSASLECKSITFFEGSGLQPFFFYSISVAFRWSPPWERGRLSADKNSCLASGRQQNVGVSCLTLKDSDAHFLSGSSLTPSDSAACLALPRKTTPVMLFLCTMRRVNHPFGGVFVCAEDSLLRHDDIWMLDGDDHPELFSRAPRPDHLDFLRITPPEDDILGDTPYCPKLECTVSAPKQHKHLQIKFRYSVQCTIALVFLFFLPLGTQRDFSPLGR